MQRIASVDIVRGIVMVIMALDHTRDLMHITALTQDPVNLQTTTAAIFLTRWITHLCAPIFVFLSGTSAFLSMKKTNNTQETSRFLLKRGFWLIVLEFTAINFGIWFDIYFHVLMQQVICAIGFGLMMLGLLVRFQTKWIALLGVTIVAAHNILQGVQFGTNVVLDNVWAVFFRPKFISVSPDFAFLVSYPLVPWLGMMLCGFACGRLFELAEEHRRRMFIRIGVGLLLLFVVFRFWNIYGDPAHWSVQVSPIFTVLSFINLTKYPPSLLFASVMLGIMFLLLAALEGKKNFLTDVLTIYGSVPLFYYLAHWYLLRTVLLVLIFSQGFGLADLNFGMMTFGLPKKWVGYELPAVYGVWFSVVLILFPLCRWYGRYKQAHKGNWLLRYI